MYRYLLIDNDDTLMDFHLAEQHALGDTLRRHGIPDSEDILSQYHAINQALWKALERGETTQAKLKVERFRQLLAALGKDESRATELGEDFADALGNYNFLLPGAEAFLRQVSAAMPVALITNGLSRIQRSRLATSPLTPMLSAVIISEEAGVPSPTRAWPSCPWKPWAAPTPGRRCSWETASPRTWDAPGRQALTASGWPRWARPRPCPPGRCTPWRRPSASCWARGNPWRPLRLRPGNKNKKGTSKPFTRKGQLCIMHT